MSSDEADHQITPLAVNNPWCSAATLKRLYVDSDIGATEDAPRDSSQSTSICLVKRRIYDLLKRFTGIQLRIYGLDLVNVCELVCIHLTSFMFMVNPRMGKCDIICFTFPDLVFQMSEK